MIETWWLAHKLELIVAGVILGPLIVFNIVLTVLKWKVRKQNR